MLQTIFLYIFIWWFIKLENKNSLIIRATISTLISIFFFILASAMFMGEGDSSTIIGGLVLGILGLLFVARMFTDIKKYFYLKDNPPEQKKENKKEEG